MAMPQGHIYACLVFNRLIDTHGGMQQLMQTSQKENMFHGIGNGMDQIYLNVCTGVVPTSKVGLSWHAYVEYVKLVTYIHLGEITPTYIS